MSFLFLWFYYKIICEAKQTNLIHMITTTGRIYSSNFIKTRISRKFARSDELFSYSKKTSND